MRDMRDLEDYLELYPTKEELLGVIAEELESGMMIDGVRNTGPVSRAICRDFERRIERSWSDCRWNSIDEGYGIGTPGWLTRDEAIQAITDHMETIANSQDSVSYDGAAALMEMVGGEVREWAEYAVDNMMDSDRQGYIFYGYRNADGDHSRLVQVGTQMSESIFSVPEDHLFFDLSVETEAETYEALVRRLCGATLEDWTREGTWWDSKLEESYDRDNMIYFQMPPGEEVWEQIRDWRFEALTRSIDNDPKPAIAFFLQQLERIDPEAHARLVKAKFPSSALKSYAAAFLEMLDNDEYEDEDRVQFIREALGMWGYEGSDAEVVLEIDRDKLEELGVTRGKWLDNAPWRLVSLPPVELAYEGTMLRHCVGRFDMGYRERVERGDIWIWSLRDKYARPRLTWEVDTELWESGGQELAFAEPLEGVWEQSASMLEQRKLARIRRGGAIRQLKGFANRHAGLGNDEQKVLEYIFDELDVDPRSVHDYEKRDKNPSETDCPWH